MERDFLDPDEGDELGIDYHTTMGPEFFQPETAEEQAEDRVDADGESVDVLEGDELGALSLSGSVTGSVSGSAAAKARAKAKAKVPARTPVLVKFVQQSLKWAKDNRVHKKSIIQLQIKGTNNLLSFFKIKSPPRSKPYYRLSREDNEKLWKIAREWLSGKLVPEPKPAAKPAPAPFRPVVKPIFRAPKSIPIVPTVSGVKLPVSMLPALLRLQAAAATPKVPVVRTPIPGMEAHVSPAKVLLAKKGISPGCACPEHHIVKDPEKRVVKLLAEAKVQREATSEHRGRMNDVEFRARVLRLLRRCVFGSQGRPSQTVPGARMREKCLRTRVCT